METLKTKIEDKLEQFHHENQTWKRALNFLKQENTFLKNRLSEVVDPRTDKEFLVLVELFQNQFIVKDEFINELLNDIRDQEKVLKTIFSNNLISVQAKDIKKQDKLRNEMEFLEKEFTNLKNEFNKYLVWIL